MTVQTPIKCGLRIMPTLVRDNAVLKMCRSPTRPSHQGFPSEHLETTDADSDIFESDFIITAIRTYL